MTRSAAGREVVPAVQKLRLRYAKRGRLRFASHRDFQRAFERALRRAEVPMAYSAGFSPHPKVSYANAAPTGTASEAEYVEIGVLERLDPDAVRAALDEALPPGLDVVEVVEARTPDLVARLEASWWRIELPGVDPGEAGAAVEALLAQAEAPVQRRTKNGMRTLDARAAILVLEVDPARAGEALGHPCAILTLVVRHGTPSPPRPTSRRWSPHGSPAWRRGRSTRTAARWATRSPPTEARTSSAPETSCPPARCRRCDLTGFRCGHRS